jgi:hypothetical protein
VSCPVGPLQFEAPCRGGHCLPRDVYQIQVFNYDKEFPDDEFPQMRKNAPRSYIQESWIQAIARFP